MLSSLPERTPAVVLVGAYESSDSSRVRFLAPQLGIERLAAYVRSQGFDVLTIDPNIDDLNQFRKLFQSKEPLVVGFSISYVTLINDFSLIYFVKKNSPSSLIVAGGQQATFDYKEILEIAPVDIVVLGEGEFPFLEIVKAAAANKDVFGISGIVYKKDKEVIRNGNNRPLSKSEFIQMTLNVDFRKINYRKYWDQIASFYESPNYSEIKTIRLFTVNYCPMQCTFCSSRTFQNAANGSVDEQFNLKGASTKMIGLDSPDLINLINNALKCYPDTRRFYLQEDEHLLLKNRVEQFCEDIISLKSKGELPEDLEFMCQARVEDVNKPLLRLMKSAGYAVIGYGVESFSKKM